jgi:8-oxo-dGTP diphosphatase
MTTAERQYLGTYDPSKYERIAVTVDLVLMSVVDGALHALLIRRDDHPAKGKWALPGGFVLMEENLDQAARRILRDKARLPAAYLEQLYTFGDVKRDPRMRVITVAYFALLPKARIEDALKASPELSLTKVTTSWSGETGGSANTLAADGAKLSLAFDHADILGLAVKRLRGKLDYSQVGFELLPPRFTLRQL